MYYYGDEKEEEDVCYVFDDYEEEDLTPWYLERLLAQQLYYRRMEPAPSFQGYNAFIKEWSTKGADGNRQDVSNPEESTIKEKLAPFFNQHGDGLADLCIGAEGEPKIYAHQLVVAMWSDKLKETIFQENLTRSLALLGTSNLELEPDDGLLLIEIDEGKECNAVFHDFMRFMYTESISLNLKTAWPIMQLASKYNVKELLETCLKFIRKRVEEISIGHCLEEFMIRAPTLAVSKGIVQMITKRFMWEIFLNEASVVSSLSVDLLCDILRSSDVVAISEFDIFLKLKAKLDALKEAGEHRQVLRLLSLLRLTQMMSSELRQFSSTVYMDEMRRAFPGKFKAALWIRALYAEIPESYVYFQEITGSCFHLQQPGEIPVNIERPRLYWKSLMYLNPAEDGGFASHLTAGFSFQRFLSDNSDAFRDITLIVRKGHQQVKVDPHNLGRDALPFTVYEVWSGQHGVVQSPSKWILAVPTGNFSVVTVRVIAPSVPANSMMFKIVLIFYKKIQGQSTSEPRVAVLLLEGHEFFYKLEGLVCPVDALQTSEDFDVTVRVCGYAFDRDPSPRLNFRELSMW